MSGHVDSSIALKVNPNASAGPDLSDVWQMAEFNATQRVQREKMILEAREERARNALQAQQIAATQANAAPRNAMLNLQLQQAQRTQEVFADPENMTPSGELTIAGQRKLFQADPQAGMEYRKNQMQVVQNQQRQQIVNSELFGKKLDMTTDVNGAALDIYDEAIRGGKPEPEARTLAQRSFTEGMDRVRKSGLFSEAEQAQLKPGFDPDAARSYTQASKEWRDSRRKDINPTPAARAEADAETIANQQIADKQKELGRPLTPAEQAGIRQTARNAPKVELQSDKDKLKLLDPDVAENVARQWVATGNPNVLAGFRRSPQLLGQIEKAILQEQTAQNLTPRDIAMRGLQFDAARQGIKSFEGGGKLEPVVRSLSVGTDHLGTLEETVAALRNGNMQLFNRLGNAYAKQTGQTAPTDFETVKRIVGDEIVKAVTGSAGALGDREAAAEVISSSNSPQQLHAAIGRYQQLMAGQLGGLRDTYNRLETGQDFDTRFLSKAAQEQLAKHGGGSGKPAAPAGAASQTAEKSPYPEFPNAKRAPDGKWYVQQNGQWHEVLH